MNFYETHFIDYLNSVNNYNLHNNSKFYLAFKNKPSNLMIFGPPCLGKYTQSIKFISYFSPSQLKYEKKLIILHDKHEYNFKLSDIHIEIDMSNLGCNSKIIWNEFSINLQNIIHANNHSIFFIICKNFHCIHNELHDVFYSYMQTNFSSTCNLYFILLTEQISFINPYIKSSCYLLPLSELSKAKKNKLLSQIPHKKILFPYTLKNIKSSTEINYNNIFNALFKCITSNDVDFFTLRNILYDILIYNVNLSDTIWYVIEQFFLLHANSTISINFTYHIFNFYWHYNNNYRPIYHLENFFIIFIKEHIRILATLQT